MEFKALEKKITSNNLPNYLIIFSTDVQRTSNVLKAYKNQIQFPELNYVELSGDTLEFTQLAETIEKLPFMDQFSTVVITKANFLTTSGKDKNKILKNLNKLSVPQHCNLILQTYIDEDENIKKNKKIPKLEKQGATIVYSSKFSLIDGKEELNKQNISIDNDTAFFIYEKVGNNLDIFINECKKVSMLPKEQLSAELLNNIVTKTTINATFDIIDVLIKNKNLQEGFNILNNLVERGTHPLEIFGALYGQIKLLYYAKAFALNNKNASEFATQFKIHPFRAKLGFEQANKFDKAKLAELFIYCNKASNDIKLSSEPKIELEKVIVKLFK